LNPWEDVRRHIDLGHFWLSHPAVRRRIGWRLAGDVACSYSAAWFRRRMAPELPLARALSVGCGTGRLERSLVSLGVAEHVTGVDTSENAIGVARSEASAAHLDGRIDYRIADAQSALSGENAWDGIFFHGSLHHLDRLGELFESIRRALAPSGLLFLDEYVGPSRDEWTWRNMVIPNLVYGLFVPKRFRRTRIVRSPVTNDDPTEMIRSSQIGPFVRGGFDVIDWRDYGGNLLALIYPSLRRPAESDAGGQAGFDRTVERLLDVEDALLRHPRITRAISHHAVIVARNRK
jgi:SAM-dependent methyltransferase